MKMTQRYARRYRVARYGGFLWLLFVVGLVPALAQSPAPCPGAHDYTDATYGGVVRQLVNADGHEHNLYHYRNPWNANNTRMVGIHEDLDHTDWRVILSDGNGCFLKELFPISQYSWQVVWDRHDPDMLYTWRSTRLYRYHVGTGQADLLKEYPRSSGTAILVPPTLNQAGDRVLVITSGPVVRSYQLPGMTNERAFPVPDLPTDCDMRHVRYIGYLNYIAVACRNAASWGTRIYTDTGALLHQFARTLGHDDFSPDGQWAYFTLTSNHTVAIRVVNIDGTNDHVVYTAQGRFQNLHITWPRQVADWFVVSFFPSSLAAPTPYVRPFDEILKLHTDGTQQWLARTRTVDTPGESFWAQAQAAVSADGSRINFNSDCTHAAPGIDCQDSVTVDSYIAYPDPGAPPPPPPPSGGGR